MKLPLTALAAVLVVAALLAGTTPRRADATAAAPSPSPILRLLEAPPAEREWIDRGRLSGRTVSEDVAAPTADPRRAPAGLDLGASSAPPPAGDPSGPVSAAAAPPPGGIAGTASNYPGTAGYLGLPTVALPSAYGGRYTGAIHGHVTVCADRCARLPVVDWCACHWGTLEQRIVDLSHPAWALISDRPISEGLTAVTLHLEGPP